MTLNHISSIYSTNLNSRKLPAGGDVRGPDRKREAPDSFNVSTDGRTLQLALRAAISEDGARAQRVAQLKQQVQGGMYEPKAALIAKAIVQGVTHGTEGDLWRA